MTGLAVPEQQGPAELAVPAGPPSTGLVAWAEGARQAHQIATSLARTPFVPASLRIAPADLLIAPGLARDDDNRRQAWAEASEDARLAARAEADSITVGNVTAAILTGQEIGLPPMAAMRSVDLIDGTPGMRAHAMRALVLSHGHDLVRVESSAERVIYRGRRRLATLTNGEPVYGEWQESDWPIQRAQRLGLANRKQWTKQPETMLSARATGEICRLIAPDVLHGVQYVTDELDGPAGGAAISAAEMAGEPAPAPARPATVSVTAEQITGGRKGLDGPSKALFGLLGRFGLTVPARRADRLALLGELVDRVIGSADELTPDEVVLCRDQLSQWVPADPKAKPTEEQQLIIGELITRGRERAAAPAGPGPDEPPAEQ